MMILFLSSIAVVNFEQIPLLTLNTMCFQGLFPVLSECSLHSLVKESSYITADVCPILSVFKDVCLNFIFSIE